MADVAAPVPVPVPVPDPALEPKPAKQMARDGESEGDVLFERDHSQSAPDEQETSAPPLPTAIPNGD